jgi:8-oxo-dGTP pyrophosphatase MutT (NUDIX family)
MNLQEFKKQVPLPLPICTLVLLIRGDEVLLAMKKRGFGQGWWNGVGGKLDPGESVLEAAVRETQEEIDVVIDPADLQPVAIIDFYFPHDPRDKQNNQQVQVFLCERWQGEPQESEEMAPKWFPKSAPPLDAMWPGDDRWLPRVLMGQTGSAEIMFNPLNAPEPVAESHIDLA